MSAYQQARSPTVQGPATSDNNTADTGFFSGGLGGLMGLAGGGMSALRDSIGGFSLGSAVDGAAGLLSDAGSWLGSKASDTWNGAMDLGGQAVDAGAGLLSQGASLAGDAASWAWDGAAGGVESLYNGLTGWNFEGRDDANKLHPSQAELDSDERWKLLGEKESIYHDNNIGAKERKYVRDDPDSFLGLGGYEAVVDGDTGLPMEAGPYQATYNYINPSKDGMGDMSLGGIGRNLGHLALDVVPYWFGGTVRGDEGTNFGQRMLGPKNYEKAGQMWDGASSWLGDTASGIGTGIRNGLGF